MYCRIQGEICNGFPIPTKVEVALETYDNGPEDKINWPNSYVSGIEIIFYLEPCKITYIS